MKRVTLATALLLGGAVIVTGCRVGPEYERLTPDMPTTWSGTATTQPTTQPTTAPSTAPSTQPSGIVTTDPANVAMWWTSFEDDTLTDLIGESLRSSPDLIEALGRVLEARALRAAASGDRLPSVDLSGGYTRTRTSENLDGFSSFSTGGGTGGGGGGGGGIGSVFEAESDLWQVGGMVNWELDVFGRLGRRVEAAARDTEAEAADYAAVRVALAADVGLAYVDVRQLQNRVRIAGDNVALQQRSLNLARARFENGLTGELDVAEALSNLQQTLATIPALESQLQAAKNRLSLLSGRTPGAVDELLAEVGPVPVPPREVAVGIPADLLRRRPDIVEAERRLAAAVARVGAAEADRYPRFSLAGSFGFASGDVGDLLDWNSRTFNVGPAFNWPIFQGGTLRALVAASDAVALQEAAAYERTVLTALQEVSDAMTAYAQDQRRRATLVDAASAARRAVELSEALYAQGLIEFDRVLDAQRTLFQAEDALASADAAVTADLIGLYRAVGGGWDAPRQ